MKSADGWFTFVIPAKAVHQFTCGSGADCLQLIRRGGPPDYNWVK